MARRKVYIAPFLPDGSGYDNFIDVTDNVEFSSLGSIVSTLDISDYDIGIFTNSGLNLNLQNSFGLYSDIDNDNTIFQFKRGDSLIKITWDLADYPFFPGISMPGEIAGGEIEVFRGLLNDDSTVLQLREQLINFNILGLDSVFNRSIAPDWTASPPADFKVSTLLKALIAASNAGTMVPVLTPDDSRINPGNDVVWDDVSVFLNKTCREVMNQLLQAANSVLYLEGTTPVVSGRTASTDIKYRFFGQGSTLGPENLSDIQDIRSGLNRVFNFLTFKGSIVSSVDVSSVARYGARAKEISVDGLTTQGKQQSVVDEIRFEFSFPKQEFRLVAPLTPKMLQIPLLGRISIDYPLVPTDTDRPPLYGVAMYDKDKFPVNLASFTLNPNDHYKVIQQEFDLAGNNAKFTLRLI